MSKSKQKKVNPYQKPEKKKTEWAWVLLAVAVVAAMIIGGIAIYNSEKEDESPKLLSGTHYVEIDIKDYGTIKAELYADIAPITVTNLLSLPRKAFMITLPSIALFRAL